MADLHSRLAEIREAQGREPMPDPTVIAGFEDNSTPIPEFVPRGPVDLSQVPDGPAEYVDEDPDFEEEPSPLIPRSVPTQTQTPAPQFLSDFAQQAEPTLTPDFAIVGRDATVYIANYLGRQVTLNPKEITAAQKVVKQAIRRVLLEELSTVTPRRKRKARATRVSEAVTEAQPALPRKRAPKQRLDGGTR